RGQMFPPARQESYHAPDPARVAQGELPSHLGSAVGSVAGSAAFCSGAAAGRSGPASSTTLTVTWKPKSFLPAPENGSWEPIQTLSSPESEPNSATALPGHQVLGWVALTVNLWRRAYAPGGIGASFGTVWSLIARFSPPPTACGGTDTETSATEP